MGMGDCLALGRCNGIWEKDLEEIKAVSALISGI